MILLFFGDIIGKPGRRAIKKVLPELKQKFSPDLTVANVENLAHGKGVTIKTLTEMSEAGIDAFTSGNHITKKGEYRQILEDQKFDLVRPANYPEDVPGREFLKLKVGKKNVYLLNFLGRVFFSEDFDCPFKKFDKLEKLLKLKKNDIIIVDFHAEATSEKVAFGWYLDGRASCVLGTHTHVTTADEKILPNQTGYITDVGMCGPIDSVIGVKKEIVIEKFLTQVSIPHEIPDTTTIDINAVLVDIDDQTGTCQNISRFNRQIKI